MSLLEHIFNGRILNSHLPANSKWLCHLQRCPVRCTLCARTHILMRRLYCFHSSWQVIFRCCYFLRCPVRFSVNKNRRFNYAFCKKNLKSYTLIDSVENIFVNDRLACIMFAECTQRSSQRYLPRHLCSNTENQLLLSNTSEWSPQ